MNTESTGIRQLKPWGSPAQMQRDVIGYQVDWERTSDFYNLGKWNLQLNGALAIGADTLVVDALSRAIRKGERIDFGTVKTVVVTIVGTEAIGQTNLTVVALTGPLPIGTLLDFGTGEQIVKLTAAAPAGQAFILVEALTIALEDGDAATYQGGENIVEVLEDVDAGATSVPVSNLEYALADNAKGYLQKAGFNNSDKFIPEGTVMALDATSKKMFPRRDAVAEEAFGLIVSDASNSKLQLTDSRSGYGLVIGGTSLWENLLPDAEDNGGDLPSAYKTELNSNTFGFRYRDYTDTRVSL